MKKIIVGILYVIPVLLLICVYGIGGEIGAYSWNLAVFIIAPISVVGTLIQIIICIVSLIKKKMSLIKALFLVVFIILSLPIFILFGVSPVAYPTKADTKESVTLKMPINDGVLIGGKDYKAHAMWPSECYAYDILKEPYDNGSSNLTDYGIYDCDVIAPTYGTVVDIENNEPDIAPQTEEFSSSLGNYIVIKIDETGTYLILAHLKQNSVLVKSGDHIEEGQTIGKVGNSGTTSQPHLHLQHQRKNPKDIKFAVCAEGLPITFQS